MPIPEIRIAEQLRQPTDATAPADLATTASSTKIAALNATGTFSANAHTKNHTDTADTADAADTALASAVASAPTSLAAKGRPSNTERSDAPQSRSSSVLPGDAAAVTGPAMATIPAGHDQCRDLQAARHYPALLRERGVQGLVRLRVKVDENGRAAEVVVSGGSGFRLLDEAARRVAESCPYLPARRGDQRVSSWIDYAVRFALQPAAAPPL